MIYIAKKAKLNYALYECDLKFYFLNEQKELKKTYSHRK